MNKKKYVIMTAAYNEESYIEKTLQSVISQTILPFKWVIVSDGSTDLTDEIVYKYSKEYDFIDLVKKKRNSDRNFGSKVNALKIGYNKLKDFDFDFIGNLDADVSFEKYYYEKLLDIFEQNSKLGIAGGTRYDLYNGKFRRVVCAPNSVGGPFQFFRRQCFEQIDGFIPLELGGEDAVAEIMARMKGWEVKSFRQLKIYHHRATGTATRGMIRAKFRDGIRDYVIGYNPIFMIARTIYRVSDKPYFLNSLSFLIGYFYAMLRGYEKKVPEDIQRYIRWEQLNRLKSLIKR